MQWLNWKGSCVSTCEVLRLHHSWFVSDAVLLTVAHMHTWKHMDVIKRLEMSLWCLQGLVGECSASDSLQTLTFSDAAAAETRLTSLVHAANPNCEYFTAKIWTYNIQYIPVHRFKYRLQKSLLCFYKKLSNRSKSRARKPSGDGKGYQIFAQVCTSPLLLCAGMRQLQSSTSGKPTLLQLSVPTISWEIFPTSPCSPLPRTDWHAQGRAHPTFPFCRANSGSCDVSVLYSHSWLCHQPVNFYYTEKLSMPQLGCTNLSFQYHFITPWDSPMLFFFPVFPLDFWSVMAELWQRALISCSTSCLSFSSSSITAKVSYI